METPILNKELVNKPMNQCNIQKKFLKIFSSLLLFLLTASPVLAQECELSCPPGVICIPNPLKYCMLDDFIYAIINFIFWVATALVPLMIVIAAFYFVTSAGDLNKIATAKKIILYTVIGYTVVLLSKGIVATIKFMVGG